MGGASTEIGAGTTDVLLEVAYFKPLAIARTSKRLGLRTEASVRFERGVDPFGLDRAVARFAELLAENSAPPVIESPQDVRGELPERPRVVVRTARVNAILGATLGPDAVAGYLEPIGFEVEPAGDGEFQVVVPSWRPDTEREIDVIEEVARHHGYGNIERTLPAISRVGGLTPYQRERRAVREILVGAGLSEAWTNSMVAPDDLRRAGFDERAVEVENPLAQEESVLRTSLLPGLLKALVTNQSHRNADVALFEIGHVFLPPENGEERPGEPERLAAALAGRAAPDAKRVWDTLVAALRVATIIVEPDRPLRGVHPSRSGQIASEDGQVIGVVGEVDPDVLAAHGLRGRVAWFEVDLGLLLGGVSRRPKQYRPVSRFPSADIDLAFTVPDAIPAAAVERVLREAVDVIEDVRLFDIYRGDQVDAGHRSLAFAVRFSALDHTITEEEKGRLRGQCIAAVQSELGASLRG
jgi:phenylalanyl-tRNA synthetase beta chain